MEYINLELARLADEAIASKKRIIVHLDTHLSIALMLGYHLDSKYGGLDITVVQKTFTGKLLWRANAELIRTYQEPLWKIEEELYIIDGTDIALSISVTHDIRHDVNGHISGMLSTVSKAVHWVISPKVGSASIKDASHIVAAIEELIRGIRSQKRQFAAASRIHLFLAAPNAFAFYLGQRLKPMGEVTLYEFDFENQRDGGYHAIIKIP